MSEEPGLTDDDLSAILDRADAATAGPWKAWVEGRDHSSGDDFIQTGVESNSPDLYVSLSHSEGGPVPAGSNDLDFIAAARQDVPRLVAEVRRLRLERAGQKDEDD